MKKLLALLLLTPSLAFCDTKISALPSTTTLNTTDIIPVVTNPSVSPLNKSITLQNMSNSIFRNTVNISNSSGGDLVIDQTKSNTFLGHPSGTSITTGSGNTGVAFQSLVSLTTGTGNTSIGYQSLNNNISGNFNTTVGDGAGLSELGGNNTYIGYNTGPVILSTLTNASAIGANAIVSKSNTMQLGASGVVVNMSTATISSATIQGPFTTGALSINQDAGSNIFNAYHLSACSVPIASLVQGGFLTLGDATGACSTISALNISDGPGQSATLSAGSFPGFDLENGGSGIVKLNSGGQLTIQGTRGVTFNSTPYVAFFTSATVNPTLGVYPSSATVVGGLFVSTITVSSAIVLSGSVGTNGQVATSGGPGAPTTWTTVSGGGGGSATLPLPAGATNYIQVTSSLQSGSTFYVSSGTVSGNLNVTGTATVGAIAISGSGTGQFIATQGADSTVVPTAGQSILWASSSSNTFVFVNGVGGSTYTVAGTTVAPVAGQCAMWTSPTSQIGITCPSVAGFIPGGPTYAVQYNNRGLFGGSSNFVQNPSSFTITASSMSITYDASTNVHPGFLDIVSGNIGTAGGPALLSVGSTNQKDQFDILDQQPVLMTHYGADIGPLVVGVTGTPHTISDNNSSQSKINFWNSGEMDIQSASVGNGGGDIVVFPGTVEVVRFSNGGSSTTFKTAVGFNGNINVSSGVLLSGAAGSSGQVLTSGGAGTVPTWTSVSASGGAAKLGISSGSATSSVVISSPTSNVVFDSATLVTSLQGSTSAFIKVNPNIVYGANVMAAPYNAACDGVTVDTAAFIAAMAANTLVYIPSGKTCIVDNLTIPNNVKLYGLDQSATLKHTPSLTTTIISFAFESNASIENLTLDDNGAAATQMIYSQNSNFKVDHVKFTNSGAPQTGLDGVFVFESTGIISNNSFDSTIEATSIVCDTEGPGYRVDIFGNNIDGAESEGIYAYNFTQNISNVFIHDNRITNIQDSANDSGQTGNAIELYQLDRGSVYNNWISTTVYSGIRLNSSNYNTVTGNHIENSDETSLYAEFGSAGNVISDNVIFHGSNGIVDTNVNNRIFDTPNIITGNFVQQMITGGIHTEHGTVVNNVIDGAVVGISVGAGGTTHNNFVSNNKILQSSAAFSQTIVGISFDPGIGAGTDTINSNSIESAANGFPIAGLTSSFSNVVTSVTLQNPVQVKYTGTQPGTGTTICFQGIDYKSTYQMNGLCGVASVITSSSFTIATINSTGFSPWVPDFSDHISVYLIVKAAGGAPSTAIGSTILLSNQSIPFASLGTPKSGTNIYVPDGTCSNGTLTGSGTGTSAIYNGTSWTCLSALSGQVALSSFTATQPILYNNATGAFTSTLISATTGFMGTLQAAQEPAHTGDVTNSAGSLTLAASAIQPNIVTMTASSVTFTGAKGVIITGTTTINGNINISSGVLLSNVAGSNGQVLTSGGIGTVPTWTTVSGGAGGGGIVSAGTFTWVNNFGIQASTLSLINSTQANILTISSAASSVLLVAVSSSPATNPSDFSLTISSQDGTTTFGVQYGGHIVSSGTAPSMGTCGTSPSVVGTDMTGHINVGSGVVTSCTLNFANPFANAPDCIASTNSTAAFADVTTNSTTSVTFGLSATLGSGVIWYHCFGEKG